MIGLENDDLKIVFTQAINKLTVKQSYPSKKPLFY